MWDTTLFHWEPYFGTVSTLPVAIVIRPARTVIGLVVGAPIEVSEDKGPICALEQVFRRIRDHLLQVNSNSVSVDDDVLILHDHGVDGVVLFRRLDPWVIVTITATLAIAIAITIAIAIAIAITFTIATITIMIRLIITITIAAVMAIATRRTA